MVDLQKKTATLAVNRTVHVTRCVDEMTPIDCYNYDNYDYFMYLERRR